MTEFVGDIELEASNNHIILNGTNFADLSNGNDVVDNENDDIYSQYMLSILVSMSIIAFIGGTACWCLHSEGYYTNVPLEETVNVINGETARYGSTDSAIIGGALWNRI
jgi:hypothetical protein